jgi:hypothetical protein
VVQKTYFGLKCQVIQSHPAPMMTGMKGLKSTKHLSNLIYKHVVNNLIGKKVGLKINETKIKVMRINTNTSKMEKI